MESVIASAVAVLGTLLGSALTVAFQRRTTDRSHRFTRRESLRQERLEACSAYAGALVNYRRCLVHLWFCEHEQPPPEDPGTVRVRAYDLRSRAQEALFRAQMLTDDEEVRPGSGRRASGDHEAVQSEQQGRVGRVAGAYPGPRHRLRRPGETVSVKARRVARPRTVATAASAATLVSAVDREDQSAMKPIAGGPRSMPP